MEQHGAYLILIIIVRGHKNIDGSKVKKDLDISGLFLQTLHIHIKNGKTIMSMFGLQ